MKFSIGDKVRFKRSGDEGQVVSIIDDQMVEVDLAGTVFPTFTDEVEHPYLKWFTDKAPKKNTTLSLPEILVEKPAECTQRLATGLYLSFLPVFKTEEMEDRVSMYKVYLLNELPIDIRFEYVCKVKQEGIFSLTAPLHSFGSIYLHNVSDEQMNDQPRFVWKALNVQQKNDKRVEGVLRIKPTKLFEHLHEILSGKDSSFNYVLSRDLKPVADTTWADLDLPEPPKPKFATVNIVNNPAASVVDLHIEKLVGSTRGLTNTDIIHIQLRVLQRSIDATIAHRQELLTVIHGLGKGTLKTEVHKILKQTNEVSRYKNEWSAKYGFGATEVWFKF